MDKFCDFTFTDKALLQQALTHRSVDTQPHYERLEFLGDRILNLYVAELLYTTFPTETEGELAKRYTTLVREETLAEIAQQQGIAPFLKFSEGEEKTGGRNKPSILADVVEALLAAVYLDGGAAEAKRIVTKLWTPLITAAQNTEPQADAKTRLQEYLQAQKEPLPTYTLIRAEGMDHNKHFVLSVTCTLGSAEGQGRSKQIAGQAAAAALLNKLGA